ncbi:g2383 [Coccomyxa viridis]|uniref:G2383 protein n=1 Tax=Coccomyxa viridis TaxID=1274662 RepID=A0ABP1FQH0_9CHLO
MEEEAAIVNGMHSTASNGDGAGFTANGLGGVTLKFDGATKRKRVTDLSSERGKLAGFGEEDAAKKQTEGVRRTIPKIENTFNAEEYSRKKRNRFIPTHEEQGANSERFEAAEAEEVKTNVQYGLNLRPKAAAEAAPAAEEAVNGAPNTRDWELAKFKADMEQLPGEADLEAYEAMPIASFGEAMLRGMGWKEGMSVGRNVPKEEVKAKEYVPRPAMLGLGAKPSEILQRPPKKHIRQGETREPKKDMIYIDSEGNQKHVKDADAKLVEREKEGVHPGKVMAVTGGTHSGLLCEVLALEPKVGERSQRATVRLQPSRATVSVRVADLGERSDALRHQAREAANGSAEPHKHSSSSKHKEQKHKHREKARDATPKPPEPWLAEHILVKIIDKRLQDGRLYLKKAEVVDVPEPTTCSIVLSETREKLSGVRQAQLETVVPREERRRVLVVLGRFRGQRAKLLRRDAAAGTVVVQLTADYSAQELSFDEVSEYVGELGEEE